MKKLLLLALFATSVGLYAQTTGTTTVTSKNVIAESDNPKYKVRADVVNFDNNTKLVEYTGDVNFVAEGVEITDADKLVYNSTTKEIIATGNLNMKLSAPISVVDNSKLGTEQKSVRYKLGDDKAYLE